MKNTLTQLRDKLPLCLHVAAPRRKLQEQMEMESEMICYTSPVHQNVQKLKFGGFYKNITRIIQ